ncbi:MAG: hypothetical protein PVF83_09470 [Anaerolineales bacterium]|jgi:hypothetical protein
MSIAYSVFTINKKTIIWLESFDIVQPSGLETMASRYPTPNEIYKTIQDLKFYIFAEYATENDWIVEIEEIEPKKEGRWVILLIDDFNGNWESVEEPHNIYFELGDEDFMIEILQRLTSTCGPFILTRGGEDPKLIMPSDD